MKIGDLVRNKVLGIVMTGKIIGSKESSDYEETIKKVGFTLQTWDINYPTWREKQVIFVEWDNKYSPTTEELKEKFPEMSDPSAIEKYRLWCQEVAKFAYPEDDLELI